MVCRSHSCQTLVCVVLTTPIFTQIALCVCDLNVSCKVIVRLLLCTNVCHCRNGHACDRSPAGAWNWHKGCNDAGGHLGLPGNQGVVQCRFVSQTRLERIKLMVGTATIHALLEGRGAWKGYPRPGGAWARGIATKFGNGVRRIAEQPLHALPVEGDNRYQFILGLVLER